VRVRSGSAGAAACGKRGLAGVCFFAVGNSQPILRRMYRIRQQAGSDEERTLGSLAQAAQQQPPSHPVA